MNIQYRKKELTLIPAKVLKTSKKWNQDIILPIYEKGDKRNCKKVKIIKIPVSMVKERLRRKIKETKCFFRRGISIYSP